MALGRTVSETLKIARDVARRLIESQQEREQVRSLPSISEAGVLGSLVNQSFRDDKDDRSMGLILLILYLACKSAIASVFAVIVNLIFVSGIVSGELFPRFYGADLSYFDMIQWALSIDPQANTDMAKFYCGVLWRDFQRSLFRIW